MLLGILDRTQSGDGLRQILEQAIALIASDQIDSTPKIWHGDALAFCWIPTGIKTLDEPGQPFLSTDRQIVLLFEGKIYNASELRLQFREDTPLQTRGSGEVLVRLYEKYGDAFLEQVNGKFAFALWDRRQHRLLLGRDHLGIESLFYRQEANRLIFGSSLRSLLTAKLIPKQLNHQIVLEYLMYCYNPSEQTLIQNVRKLPAGYYLSLSPADQSLRQYWSPSFADIHLKTESQYCEEIPALIQDAVRIRLDPQQPLGVFLSGGIDSSAMLGFATQLSSQPPLTYSFRCAGKSYDESSYARFVAQHFGTQHTEIAYEIDDLAAIAKMVAWMDEPFCDIGIEIGTFLLGSAAQGQISYAFSGEGGDELFGGHPVYTADKVAAFADRLPQTVSSPILQLLQTLPDSDQKKNLQVKLKRFAYSLAFPPQLLSHRWRAYYKPAELLNLCTPAFLTGCALDCVFDSMFRYTEEADGPDPLSRSLYSDYWTLVNFYLRRLELLRSCGIESRLPLLDPRLIEYAAKIPARLKIRGFSDTKYIYKKALVGTVPDSILFNRPKLGHSIPMKNWLRDGTQNLMLDVLSSSSFTERGLFNTGFVQRLMDEHQRKTHNHSHRLWALLVLELWLQDALDG